MDWDKDYEFNAPKYIDFLANDPENERLDSWFDENPDGHEGGVSFSEAQNIEHHSNFDEATKKISAALLEDSCGLAENIKTEKQDPVTIVKMEASPKRIAPVETENITPTEVKSSPKEITPAVVEPSPMRITRSSVKEERKTPVIMGKKRKSCTPIQTAGNRSKAGEDKNGGASTAKKPRMEMKKPMITVPTTPSLMKRIKKKLGANKKTTEAIEIERIKELQQETKKRLKENQTFLHKALAPKPIQQQKADTELTRTVEFSFATDSRLKQHPMKTRSEEGTNGKKFSEQLRKHPRSPSFKNKKPTKPVPFNFTSNSSGAKQEAPHTGAWKSVASSCSEFHSKTPDRWRSRPANQQNTGPHVDEKSRGKMPLTHPKTPQLMTKRRCRSNAVPGQVDMEEKVVEEMKSYKFKAQELDPRILQSSGYWGVKPMQRLPLTETKPFRFESDNRLEIRKKHGEEEDGKTDQGVQEKASKVKDASCSKPTRKRCALKKTEPKPFSFEKRDKEMLEKKQAKIQMIYEQEEKDREFHARPLPSLSPEQVVVKPGRLVEPEPFNLATDERGAVRVQKWNSQLQKELEEEKEKTKFKAKPCVVVHKEAFVPKPSAKPLVEISQFKLNTEERSKKRDDFEMTKKEQQRIKEDEMQHILRERQEEEEREITRLRKETVHHAQPVRNLGEVEIRPSEKPLTLPETPKFETNKRFGCKLAR